MRNTKSKVIVAMFVALLFMATGYALYASDLSITSTGNITAGWNIKFISITDGNNRGTGGSNASTPKFTDTTATMSANLQVPGDYMEYEVVLQNAGNINAIIQKVDAVATGSPAIIFSVSGINEGDKLEVGALKTIKIKIEFDPNVTSQPSETTKTLMLSVLAVQDTGQEITPNEPNINQPIYLSSAILQDNTTYADTYVDFSLMGGYNGLYYTSTNTEDNKTTYYFRGDVENNYVKFATETNGVCVYNGEKVAYSYRNDNGSMRSTFDVNSDQCVETTVCLLSNGLKLIDTEKTYSNDCTDTGEYATYVTQDILWRIVRINEDGSIRLITQEPVGNIEFNIEYKDNAYVGYMYGDAGSNTFEATHANINDSTIKTYLDNWYKNNLNSYTHLMSTDAGFCNDRSIASSAGMWEGEQNFPDSALGYGKNTTYYGAYNRLANLNNPQQQFACPNPSNDLFTVKSSSVGNKALTYPIGLLTADEALYAGINSTNIDTYLSSNSEFWTMSPANFIDFISQNWMVSSVLGIYGVIGDATHMGDLGGLGTIDMMSVRPVINLNSTVQLSTELPSGCTRLDGTKACPYIIKTN